MTGGTGSSEIEVRLLRPDVLVVRMGPLDSNSLGQIEEKKSRIGLGRDDNSAEPLGSGAVSGSQTVLVDHGFACELLNPHPAARLGEVPRFLLCLQVANEDRVVMAGGNTFLPPIG